MAICRYADFSLTFTTAGKPFPNLTLNVGILSYYSRRHDYLATPLILQEVQHVYDKRLITIPGHSLQKLTRFLSGTKLNKPIRCYAALLKRERWSIILSITTTFWCVLPLAYRFLRQMGLY